MNQDESTDIEALLLRINALEISNDELRKEVSELKDKVRSKEATTKSLQRKCSHSDELFIDRYGTYIEQGVRVYIITNGAFTHISRKGRVTAFDETRNRVYILDEAGNEQERAAKNVKVIEE